MRKYLTFFLILLSFTCFSQEKYILKNSNGNILKNSSGSVLYHELDPLFWLTTKDTSLSDYTYRDGGQGFGNYVDTVLDYSSHGYIAGQTTASYQPVLCNPSDSVGWSFDGISDYLGINSSVLSESDMEKSFTINLWFKARTTDTYVLLTNRLDGGTYAGFQLYLSGGTSVRFFLDKGSSATAQSVKTINYGTDWHMATVTYNGADLRIFVDNVEGTGSSETIAVDGTFDDIKIGAQYNLSNHYDGLLDDIILENKAWSQTKIEFIYNQQKPRHP